jgi:hypothetical protein
LSRLEGRGARALGLCLETRVADAATEFALGKLFGVKDKEPGFGREIDLGACHAR